MPEKYKGTCRGDKGSCVIFHSHHSPQKASGPTDSRGVGSESQVTPPSPLWLQLGNGQRLGHTTGSKVEREDRPGL